MGVFFTTTQNNNKMFNKDFGKSANDFLTKDFPSNFEAELVSNTPGSLKVTSNISQNADGTFTNSIKPTFRVFDKADAEVTLCSDGTRSIKLSGKDVIINNLKSSLTFEAKGSRDDAGNVTDICSATYAEDFTYKSMTSSLKVVVPCCNFLTPRVTAGGVYVHNANYAVGAEGQFNLGTDQVFQKGTVNAQYTCEKFVGTVSATSAGNNVTVGSKFFYVHPKFIFAAGGNFGNAFSGEVAFGKALLGGALTKVALRTNGTVGVSYKNRICEHTQMTVGAEVDVNTHQHKIGFAFDFAM